MKLFRWIFLFCILLPTVFADDPNLSWSENIYKHIHDYKVIHNKFSTEVCTPGTENKYYQLLRQYRSDGRYLPDLADDIDRDAILINMPHFKKKIKHISQIVKRLEKEKELPNYKVISEGIEQTIKELLELKKLYNTEILQGKRDNYTKESKKKLAVLKNQYDFFMDKIFFLKTYNYPNDHLANRMTYDNLKFKEDLRSHHKSNKIFFYRRIVEDGAYDPDHTRPDQSIRATFDTIKLKLNVQGNFISEDLRHDLEWILRRVEYILARGYNIQLARAKEWLARTEETHNFYQEIIKSKNKKQAKKHIKDKVEATKMLKQYVAEKQKESYIFWSKQPELHKALYSLETILFNEVGTIDGEDALERKDVVYVVLNRMHDLFYRSLDQKQDLWFELIKTLKAEQIQNEYWLNVLFRVGEFSFTYYYIGGAVKIFCPDMSRRGRNLREENLKISLKAMKEHDPKFRAMRYFSRTSMLGKIDISSVWSDYVPIPERRGVEVFAQDKLKSHYMADKYTYLYSFTDPAGAQFQVLDIDGETYCMTWERGRPKFYHYRDPHLFKYFQKK